MRYLLLLVGLASLFEADTLTVNATANYGAGLIECTDPAECQLYSPEFPQIEMDVPQFNPALGQLESIGYSFRTNQDIQYDVLGSDTLGAYELDFVSSIASSALGINTGVTGSADWLDVYTLFVGAEFGTVLSQSGIDSNLLDLGMFTGTGTAPVLFEPSVAIDGSCGLSAADCYSEAIITPIDGVRENIQLSATYAYTPEPRWAVVILAGLFLLFRWVMPIRTKNS